MDEREQAILKRSAEILARQPTPEEIAEHEARVKATRIAEIMTPKPAIVHRVQENAVIDKQAARSAKPATRRYVDGQIDALIEAIISRYEPRLAVLEATAKPRHRVKAPTRRT